MTDKQRHQRASLVLERVNELVEALDSAPAERIIDRCRALAHIVSGTVLLCEGARSESAYERVAE